jgi:hypothetical protein
VGQTRRLRLISTTEFDGRRLRLAAYAAETRKPDLQTADVMVSFSPSWDNARPTNFRDGDMRTTPSGNDKGRRQTNLDLRDLCFFRFVFCRSAGFRR